MAEETAFPELIQRVRAGDEQAAAELVRRYEPAIRVAVRVRLTDPGLRRFLDSMDICQSVLANFFSRAATGQFELDKPEQLLNLLVTMARNKVTNHALKQQADRRDQRRVQKGGLNEDALVAAGPTPSQLVANQELLMEFRKRLSDTERRLADQRAQGRSWADIAAEWGSNADTLRMQLTRAVNRVTRELRLEE
ncbi:MAG TPA: sigma-70 family RNA polymerase sigma factor [Gemmataceae bacterium]|jgi:RNA polymerase sigma-70 factor (ECF subfamily)|nr:sigma-70 family RNA polymerase sigma factor [Gemmataceae bacterium]